MNKIDIDKSIQYWIKSSDKDFETMLHLFETKDYHWSLFIGHIVIEKLLKACILKTTSNHAPFTHDLSRLAAISKMEISIEHQDWLDAITTFNLNARYDSYKQDFYLKCTPEFTLTWIDRIKILRLWITETQLK